MTYAPPPSPGQTQYGYTGLYLLPSDGSGPPQPVLEHAASKESFFQPVWSPDGQHIYFAHLQVVTDANGTPGAKYTIERLMLPNGQPEQVAENAYWPRLSPDGSKLAYVSFDPTSYTSKLYVANSDGSNAAQIALPDTLVVDAPLFSPDGQWLYFSGADLAPPAASSRTSPWRWLDQLLGVQTASAHNIPSDWWRVPVAGGQPRQLTELYDSGLYGVFPSEGQVMVFITITGLFVMQPDGTDLRMILPGTGTYGTVDWIP
jgi:Tol biopolymer transport system component